MYSELHGLVTEQRFYEYPLNTVKHLEKLQGNAYRYHYAFTFRLFYFFVHDLPSS